MNAEYLIWWTDQVESETIIGQPWYKEALDKAPDYINKQFQSRLGRAGRGRLWVADDIGFPGDDRPWPEKPAANLAERRAGIVIKAEDKDHVFRMPGFLTDLELNFLNE